ncbi:vesicular glutamate transporter 2-like [Amphibalanus amphitrite]|uniref:vesicular glutamate transporter 2-like n=1 Tax=Amphibalanus amphitrite TaxID=1232801 RepID=UPI001C9224A0|nr:vesicular glutamate transporter 2-like [Amphibalanus amphitrite]
MDAKDVKNVRFFSSVRFAVSVTLHLAMLITLMIRFNVGTAFLCMVNDGSNTTSAGQSGADASPNATAVHQGEFDWDKAYQGWITATYFYAFVIFLVPGGWLVDRYGARAMLLSGMFTAGVTSLAIPELTRLHSGLLIMCRAILGATNCVIIPSMPAVSRRWSLPGEYTTVFAIAWSGFYLGTALNFPLATALCQSSWGWPGVFYVAGIISMAWMVLAVVLVRNDPLESGLVRGLERDSFQHCQASTGTARKSKSVPLLKIFTNFQVWNVAIAFTIGLWNLYSSTIAMPQFMKTFMDFDLSQNGAISAAPYLLLTVISILTGRLFTYLNTVRGVSKTTLRKGFNFFSNFFPAFLLLAAVLLPREQRAAAVTCLVLSIGLTACVFTGGPYSGSSDIGPLYTATIFSIAACLGNVPGFVIPPLLAAMTPNDSRDEWVHFVSISVALHLFSSFYQLFFWSSKVQPFSREEPQEQEVSEAPPEYSLVVKDGQTAA